jgi:hypothetical protein
MADVRRRVGRKLLVASIGVASVTFGACGSSKAPVADAAADAAAKEASAEVAPAADASPEAPADATVDTGSGDATQDFHIIANLASFLDDDAGA